MEIQFTEGQVVKHKFTGDRAYILRKGREQYLVRLSDYKEIWVYPHEIVAAD